MHHAYLLIGGLTESRAQIPREDNALGVDTSLFEYDSLGITEARFLRHAASLRPVERSHRVFIISFDTVTVEAQNALLKLLEDPGESARFYLITKHDNILLPTLRSRLMSIMVLPSDVGSTGTAFDFLASSYAKRLTEIGERMKEKDTAWAECLLNELESWAHERKEVSIIEDVIFLRRYERTKNASLKMLLEHLALSLPVVPEVR